MSFRNYLINESVENTRRDYLFVLLSMNWSLYFAALSAHWNVEGENFVSLHEFYKKIYEDAFEVIDTLAEFIRADGEYVNLNSIELEDNGEDISDPQILNNILLDNFSNVVYYIGKALRDPNIGDEVSNFLQDKLEVYKKYMWMLKSSTKRG